MGIAAEIVRCFQPLSSPRARAGHIVPNTVGDFCRQHPEHWKDPLQVAQICRRLVVEGVLVPAGTGQGSPPMSEAYYAFGMSEDAAQYGTYDFLAFGFPLIRTHFSSSVLPVVVIKSNGSVDIGSGFVAHDGWFVTARHCVQGMKNVDIPGLNLSEGLLHGVFVPKDSQMDLALLRFDGPTFAGRPHLRFDEPKLLEPVLVMGYPPIPGFDSVLVAETAEIAGHLKSSTGQLVAKEQSYLDGQTHLLITARVKGGSSGGPVIGRHGSVVGLVTQLPAEAEGRADLLGFAAALPSSFIMSLLPFEKSVTTGLLAPLDFSWTGEGFRIGTAA